MDTAALKLPVSSAVIPVVMSFEDIDANGDGVITQDEWRQAHSRVISSSLPSRHAE